MMTNLSTVQHELIAFQNNLNKLNTQSNQDVEKKLQDSDALPINLSEIKSVSNSTKKALNSLSVQSFIDKISSSLKKIPFILRLIFGAVFLVPIIAGATAASPSIIIISAGLGIAYYTTICALEDHANFIKVKKSDLHNIAQNVAEMIESISIYLSSHIATLSKENKILEASITRLETKIQGLHRAMKKLQNTEKKLQNTEKKLEVQVNELKNLKNQYASEVAELKNINGVLQGTLAEMSQGLLIEQDDREKFVQRLKEFVHDGKKEFNSVAKRICHAEKELAKVKSQLEVCNHQYNEHLNKHSDLLNQQEAHMTFFNHLSGSTFNPNTPAKPPVTSISQHSLYASSNDAADVAGKAASDGANMLITRV